MIKQLHKVYNAEYLSIVITKNEFSDYANNLDLKTEKEIKLFVRKISNQKKFIKSFPNSQNIRFTKIYFNNNYHKIGEANHRYNTIQLSKKYIESNGTGKLLILHELAHLITDNEFKYCIIKNNKYNTNHSHCEHFIYIYLKLVKMYCGKQIHDILKLSCRVYKVKTMNKKQKPIKITYPKYLNDLYNKYDKESIYV